jgi:uncharacterized protein (DUF111 family)
MSAESQYANVRAPILYVDPFSGIAGDMFLGALLDLGVDLERLKAQLAQLGLSGVRLSSSRVMRGPIAAVKFEAEEGAHGQHHHHAHEHRTHAAIQALIQKAPFSARVKADSLKVFQKLAEAEGRIHNLPPEKVAFHEVGAVDSIVDICGVCLGLEMLGVGEIWSGSVAVGNGGFVQCRHGTLPLPAPATLELLKGIPIKGKGQTPICEANWLSVPGYHSGQHTHAPEGGQDAHALEGGQDARAPRGGQDARAPGGGQDARGPGGAQDAGEELTTPTGAALLAALATGFGPMPPLTIAKIGYGAGSRNNPDRPNVLRVLLGTREASPEDSASSDNILEIQTNLDDSSPEVLGYLAEALLAAGALDVFFAPIQMKKFRPGILLTILAEPAQLDALAAILFKESSAFGLRYRLQARLKLSRRTAQVATPYGPVRVKIGCWLGQEASVHPEFDDCQALAAKNGVPVKAVMDAARLAHGGNK